MTCKIHNNDHITKLFYILKRKGVSRGLKYYCVLELLHWQEITTDEAYKYLDLCQEDLEKEFNNLINKKENASK